MVYPQKGQPALAFFCFSAPEPMSDELPILYRDADFIAINKPSGLLVHRSMIDRHETRFALQLLRDQIGQRVYPLHRLDKPTSGVLLFALSPEAARDAGEQFAEKQLQKTYLAITRGYAPESGVINHPLREELDKISDKNAQRDKPAQEAITRFERLATTAQPFAIDRYPKSRFSLVQCQPLTGRKHQIRRHLKHISHPIIGDAKHGKGNYNRYFAKHLNAGRLLLTAIELELTHPYTHERLVISAPLDGVFQSLITRFHWREALPQRWCKSLADNPM